MTDGVRTSPKAHGVAKTSQALAGCGGERKPLREAAEAMPQNYLCCICKQSLPVSGEQAHFLDPCALVLVAHIDKEWRDQKEQTFYCHFACFRRLVRDDSCLYIMEPDFSTNGEVQDEQAPESGPGQES
jgi:hypothetical protein